MILPSTTFVMELRRMGLPSLLRAAGTRSSSSGIAERVSIQLLLDVADNHQRRDGTT